VKVIKVTNGTVTINVSSETQTVTLIIGKTAKFDVSEPRDRYYDLFVRLESINNNKSNLTVKKIYEKVSEPVLEKPKKSPEEGIPTRARITGEVVADKEKGKLLASIIKVAKTILWVFIIILIIGAIIILIIMGIKKMKIREWKETRYGGIEKREIDIRKPTIFERKGVNLPKKRIIEIRKKRIIGIKKKEIGKKEYQEMSKAEKDVYNLIRLGRSALEKNNFDKAHLIYNIIRSKSESLKNKELRKDIMRFYKLIRKKQKS